MMIIPIEYSNTGNVILPPIPLGLLLIYSHINKTIAMFVHKLSKFSTATVSSPHPLVSVNLIALLGYL